MLSATTLEILQIQNDLTAKAYLLVVILGYMIYSYWQYNKLEFDSLSNKILKLGYFIYSRVTIFFYPLMVVTFLHINTTLEEMIIFISGLYGIVLVVTFGLLFLMGFEKVLDMLGIDRGSSYK